MFHRDATGRDFDRVGTGRDLAKDSSEARFGAATRRAETLLFMDRVRFESEAEGARNSTAAYGEASGDPVAVYESAAKARAELPMIGARAALWRFMQNQTPGGRFKSLGAGSEGTVVLDTKGKGGFVYKLMRPAFHLAGISSKPGAVIETVNHQSKYALPQVARVADEAGPGADMHERLLMLANDGAAYNALMEKFPELRDNEDWADVVGKEVFTREKRADKFTNLLMASESDNIFDTLNKVDRQSRIPGGLPIEIQGLMLVPHARQATEKLLVLKMPRMKREANISEVGDFMRDHGWISSTSEWDPYGYQLTRTAGHDQPIAKDAHGNSYATADVREWQGTYPNFMVGQDGKVYAIDVMFRPIDSADIASDKQVKWAGGLERYAPVDESQILYSPETHGQGQLKTRDMGPDEPRKTIRELRKTIGGLLQKNPEAVRPQLIPATGRVKKQGYDLADSPVAAKEGMAKAEDLVADKMVSEIEAHKDNPQVMEAKTWYPKIRDALRRVFGASADMVGQLLAATSARTGVEDNFAISIEAMRRYSRGDYDGLLSRYVKFIEEGGKDKDWTEMPLKENGAKFNANSRQVLRVLAATWAEKAGIKTGQFADNLTGADSGATIDVWAARTVRRMLYDDGQSRWRILPLAEKAVSKKDFRFAQRAMAKAGARLGLAPEAAQAILWFGEKQHWAERGWTKGTGANMSSFGNEMTKLTGGNLPGELGLDLSAQEPVRVQAGLTDFTTPETFTMAGHNQFLAGLRQAMRKLPGLMAMRVQHTEALYGGAEPSMDMEATYNNPQSVERLDKLVFREGRKRAQSDTMFSEVVNAGHANARPGMEVIFRRPIQETKLPAILETLTKAGLEGMTPYRDQRGRVTGFRAQWCPEIAYRWGAPEVRAALLDPAGRQAHQEDWLTRTQAAVDTLGKDGVRSAKTVYYDTRVYGKEDTIYPQREVGGNTLAGEMGRRANALGGR
jgi:hypothetical protein